MSWLSPLLMTGGGILGGLLGGKSSSWSGEKGKLKQYETLTKDQRKLLEKLLTKSNKKLFGYDVPRTGDSDYYKQGMDYFGKILSEDPALMKQFEDPYKRRFSEEIIPGISERFSGLGAQSSSAFGQAMGAAGSGLEEKLAQLRAGLKQQAAQGAMTFGQIPFSEAMQRQQFDLTKMLGGLGVQGFGTAYMPGTPGIGQGLSSGLMSSGLQGLTSGGGLFDSIGRLGEGLFSGIGKGIGSLFGF